VKRVVAIRPEPGLSRTLAVGREAGLDIDGTALFEVRPLAWEPPPVCEFDALLVGSANALRHGGPALSRYDALPVHAVGRETGAAALAAGFTVERVGTGGLRALLDDADRPRRYLRLAGRAHVPLAASEGTSIVTRIVYESVPLAMPASLAGTLAQGAVVLLHSGEAARHLSAECDRFGIARGSVALAALAPRIAAAAGSGWAALRSAEMPEERALLSLARDMCH
jgi:uroporphyrinogen-III synthase